MSAEARRLTRPGVRRWLPARPRDSHKGDNGHALIVAGSCGMSGAAYLASLGALKAGAGLVTAAVIGSERAAVARRLPEALSLPLPERQGAVRAAAAGVVRSYADQRRIAVLAMGPGLSQQRGARALVLALMRQWSGPIVLDADGLNVLKARELGRRAGPLVITPHPGEFTRLFGHKPGPRDRDRIAVAREAARRYRLVCVLKGARTVVTDGRAVWVNTTGNPAMAAGGMGDVLTGVIAGLWAQGLAPLDAAAAGVFIHGLAGDLARQADRGLLASELALAIPQALQRIGVSA